MSNKSGTSSNVISLPKGGGALQGIGETFSPDLHTGTGNFTVPIVLPPGRNGFQPELNLVYSTGNGNGPFGLGWGLSIPGVSRKTAKGVPHYRDYTPTETPDLFVLSGAEELVPVAESAPNVTRYRPRTEGLFARIDHHHGSQNNFWEVRSKDGLVSIYGTPRPAEAAPGWRDPAVVADPVDPGKIFSWKLTRTVDPFGNRICYDYERDTGREGPHHWDQLYLKRIRYVDYSDSAGQEQFLVSATFEYEELPNRYPADSPDVKRIYPYSDYRAGFEIRTRKRCRRIEIRTHAGEERLVRSYELVYLDQRDDLESLERLLPLNGVSILSQIKVVGHDDNHKESLPPLEFGYTRFEPEGRDFFPLVGQTLPAHSLGSPDLELADLFGNGLPDIIQMNGAVRYWQNLGDGRFALPRTMEKAPTGLRLADAGVQLIDADGDGRIDLLATTNGLSGYFPLNFSGQWDRRSFQRYRTAPSFNLEDPDVKLVDLNGDGVTDAIRSGVRLECFFNDPEKGWTGTRFVERQALEMFPNVNFSDPRVKWADMTGDGLQDILLVNNGSLEYWPSLGHGNWGRRVLMRHSPRFPYGYNPQRILIGDVDGDGLADMVYIDDNSVTLWINQSGHGWSEPIKIEGTPTVSDMDSVRLVDLLGSGISGVLWSSDASGLRRTSMFFLDFTGGVKPYLLNEMNNNLGAVTRVAYRPSTRFYQADAQQQATRWHTPLPFPVQVVARVEVIDQLLQGKLTTEYRYHHGYWDGAEREFRGFGLVEQYDTEHFEAYNGPGLHDDHEFNAVEDSHFSPPTLTKTWFHQGPIGKKSGDWAEPDYSHEYWPDDPSGLKQPQVMSEFLTSLPRQARRDALRTLRGRVLRTELYALDGTEHQDRPYTVTEHLYGLREESPPNSGEADHRRIFFPHALAERTSQWERGDEPLSSFTFSDDYDAYGQARSQISVAVPRKRDYRAVAEPGQSYLATHTVNRYAQRDDEQRYIVDRQASSTQIEIINDGRAPLFELVETIRRGEAEGRVIGHALNFYDGSPFEGLEFGQLGDYGALVRSERLILTHEVLEAAYGSGEVPSYLDPDGSSGWAAEYPDPFCQELPELAGYLYRVAGSNSPYLTGYYVAAERRRYDFQLSDEGLGHGLVLHHRDPLGHDTKIGYDGYQLLPAVVIDPVGLRTWVYNDYRVFQPRLVLDPNLNRTVFKFSPLGLLQRTIRKGKSSEQIGESFGQPGMLFTYDFSAFAERGQPVSVRTSQSVHHIYDVDVSLSERKQTIDKVEYSDGFGRLIQTRAQAEEVTFGDPVFGGEVLSADQSVTPGEVVGRQQPVEGPPNVVVSGWQIYDNKGRVVEKYEPFFATGWAYEPPSEVKFGQKVRMTYDPRGQVIRTVNPNGSEKRVIYGVPGDLTAPEQVMPTPWEAYTYDENDNAGRTHAEASLSYQSHWNTPASTEIDALGRTVKSVERTGSNPERDWYVTKSSYDIRGKLLNVTDPLGRVAFQYVYDLAGNPLRIENIDAGVRRILLDAAGNEIERRDSKGALILQSYDTLGRPSQLWARDERNGPITLRERLIYGDGGRRDQPAEERAANRVQNRLGKLYQHYDEAGCITFDAYDFKGNVLEKTRQVIRDDRLNVDFRIDWHDETAHNLLDPTRYQTSFTYDALDRVKSMHYPQDVAGNRKTLKPYYNRAGALERVELDGSTYVEHIAYNAKGQRTLIVYGNEVMTRYAYDPVTFQLARLRTERYRPADGAPWSYQPTAPDQPLQDFAYQYDLAGNVTQISDRTPGCGLPSRPDQLDRVFTYDPLSRLLSATGRECDRQPETPWDSGPRCADLSRTRPYNEQYQYDPAGNLTRLQHQANDGNFTREFALVPDGNRLDTVAIGQWVYDYSYDANGNLIRETSSRHFEWDHSDQLRAFRIQAGEAEPSLQAFYLYDSNGQRTKKLVRTSQNRYEVAIYIDGLFEHRYQVRGNARLENTLLHVMDDQQRIALMRVGKPFADDKGPPVQYHLGDHLGSSHLVTDDSGNWLNREEYTPYGETSLGAFAQKRYRFTGKERDAVSGLYYHGARYYAPWLGRWISCDPEGMIDGINLYEYVNSDPVRLIDESGTQSDSPSLAEIEAQESNPNLHNNDSTSRQEKTREALIIALRQPEFLTGRHIQLIEQAYHEAFQRKVMERTRLGMELAERPRLPASRDIDRELEILTGSVAASAVFAVGAARGVPREISMARAELVKNVTTLFDVLPVLVRESAPRPGQVSAGETRRRTRQETVARSFEERQPTIPRRNTSQNQRSQPRKVRNLPTRSSGESIQPANNDVRILSAGELEGRNARRLQREIMRQHSRQPNTRRPPAMNRNTRFIRSRR